MAARSYQLYILGRRTFKNFIQGVFICSQKSNAIKKLQYSVLLCGVPYVAHKTVLNKCLISQVKAKTSTDDEIILEADDLYSKSESGDTLYEYLKVHKNSKNADILWRIARSARDRALKNKSVSADEKKALIYEAFECAKRALEQDDNNFGSHKWFAITIGDVGDYEGTKSKIANAFIIRDHLERAIQLNPKDATSVHCLGMWCFVFADMPWYQHKIASVLFTTPPTSSYREAADLFQLAEKVEPNFYSVNLLMLGKCYAKLDDVKHAMLYLDKAATYPVSNEEDKEAAREARLLLEDVIKKHKK